MCNIKISMTSETLKQISIFEEELLERWNEKKFEYVTQKKPSKIREQDVLSYILDKLESKE